MLAVVHGFYILRMLLSLISSTFCTHSLESNIKSFSKWLHWRGVACYCRIIMMAEKKRYVADMSCHLIWKQHRCQRQGRMQQEHILNTFRDIRVAQSNSKSKQWYRKLHTQLLICSMFTYRGSTEFICDEPLMTILILARQKKITVPFSIMQNNWTVEFYYDYLGIILSSLAAHVVNDISFSNSSHRLFVCASNIKFKCCRVSKRRTFERFKFNYSDAQRNCCDNSVDFNIEWVFFLLANNASCSMRCKNNYYTIHLFKLEHCPLYQLRWNRAEISI